MKLLQKVRATFFLKHRVQRSLLAKVLPTLRYQLATNVMPQHLNNFENIALLAKRVFGSVIDIIKT